jgi:hypothetical protein
MVGFIKGLFGGRSQENNPQPEEAEVNTVESQKPRSYYLDPDDAKTLGNIDYMRTAKTVRRTFPKAPGATEAYEMVQQVSSMDKLEVSTMNSAMTEPSVAPSDESAPSLSKTSNEAETRRSTDSSMDMFRKMARDMKR